MTVNVVDLYVQDELFVIDKHEEKHHQANLVIKKLYELWKELLMYDKKMLVNRLNECTMIQLKDLINIVFDPVHIFHDEYEDLDLN